MSKKTGRPVRPYGNDWGRTSSWGGPIKPRSPMGGTTDKGRDAPVRLIRLTVLVILLVLFGYNVYLMCDIVRIRHEIVRIQEGR